jgi:hypothetical protein
MLAKHVETRVGKSAVKARSAGKHRNTQLKGKSEGKE